MHVDYYRVKGKIKLGFADESKKIELALSPDMFREIEGMVCCTDYSSGKAVINNLMQFNEVILNYYSGSIGKLEWKLEESLKNIIDSGIFVVNGEIVVTDSMSKDNDFVITIKDNEVVKEKKSFR